ncbi:MAG: cyclic nucleotide-binding domain-containing protein [Sodalinema sp.]|uniref:cyclic nucleotide-binding domain-containing protein n=1 Tax=Sodalinema sp. TaxID=3080550 RepID=UPI00396F713C
MLQPVRTVEIFQKQTEPQHYKAGDVIFREGEPGETMFGIIEGAVDLVVDDRVVETIDTGDVFGEGALVRVHRTRASTAVAQTDCTLAVMDLEKFLFAVQETPMFALEIMYSLSERLRRFKHPTT